MSEEVNQELENAPLEKPSVFGMIMSPGVQFERIKKNPKIIVALIIVTLLSIIGLTIGLQGVDFANDPQLGDMDEEMVMITTMIAQIGVVIGGLFAPVVAILISALIYFAVSKFTQSEVTFKQLFSMTTFIYFISVLSLIVNGIVIMFVGAENVDMSFTSLNAVVGADGFIGGMLNSIEIFSIWVYIITALGLQIVAGFSQKLAWTVVIIFFVVGLILAGISGVVASMPMV